MPEVSGRSWTDDELAALFDEVDNAGRWGPDDELGTLNHIAPETRRAAAGLVREGEVLSLSVPLVERPAPAGPMKIERRFSFHVGGPDDPAGIQGSADEWVGLDVHQPGLTHLDCVSHMAGHDGRVYNRRPFADVALDSGLTHGSIDAQRGGIFSRGVLLDIPAALGVAWLEGDHEITVAELEAAERHGAVRVSTGDVLVLRAGAEAQAEHAGPSPLGPGPGPDAIRWFHEREIAVYAGDAPERRTELAARILGLLPPADGPAAGRGTRFPLPLHQIGIPAMGLVLLDHARVEELARTCRRLGRHEFLFVASPLAFPGGTGSPVNPLAIF